jgi:hypothetical protein
LNLSYLVEMHKIAHGYAYVLVLQALFANAYLLGETPFAYIMTKRGSSVGEIFSEVFVYCIEGELCESFFSL